ncbi:MULTISPECIES: enolase C-terminal domain-like protein [Roseobacteraceae]|jgi:L-alanine-DL-glutamate epimerase-like enolase superfamily enzyme|uniref:enolase C-terminal domain-like protein n=1 Tax=Roseobacteraceae TaxID=2854170 RepID=UPI0007C28139|nr:MULTISPECIES: enolase C-terminal domain-like protein [unclassified Sulfitobacter]KZX94087.1 mandelate racemase [Sulfitobacter sp. HI0023]KZY25967.1 mandelate racemase [Sulfitobacter sp. HI0040]KZY50303.1 mandelate racemase [Sulfitobacter sp. HI0054]KZZ66558.1 mandelate racemase [Sulfitobacter sp. HI0129]
MKIVSIRQADLPISSPGKNAVVDFAGLRTSAVAIVTDQMRNGKTLVGYGFGSIGRWAEGGVLTDRLIPRLMAEPPDALLDDAGILDPIHCAAVAMRNEKPGGHGGRAVAMGALDMAMWDLVAKAEERPLYRVLADRFRAGAADTDIAVYAAGGYYGSGGMVGLEDEIRSYLDRGYREVKIKVGAAPLSEDISRIEAALALLGHDGSRLAVDANGRFTLDEALAFGRAIAPYSLRWYEEAGDPLDFRLQAVLAESYEAPLATGENLFSHQDARNLFRYAGMRPDRDIVQFDAGLSYGLSDYMKTLALMDQMGWSRRRLHPHGGHQMSLHIAAGLGLGGNESYPGVFQPLGGFADDQKVSDGRVCLPDVPGIGLELKSELWKWLQDNLS